MCRRARQNQFEVDLGRQQYRTARRTKLCFVIWNWLSFFPGLVTKFVLLCLRISILPEDKSDEDIKLIRPGIQARGVGRQRPACITKFRNHPEVTGFQLNATTCDKPNVGTVQGRSFNVVETRTGSDKRSPIFTGKSPLSSYRKLPPRGVRCSLKRLIKGNGAFQRGVISQRFI